MATVETRKNTYWLHLAGVASIISMNNNTGVIAFCYRVENSAIVISQTEAANETLLFELFCHAVGGRDTK